MSQTIQIPNYTALSILESAGLDADALAGTTTLAVTYSDQMAADSFILIGLRGSESAELCQIDSVTDANTIVLTSATTKDHNRFDPITILYGDKIKIYRAVNSDGTAPDDGDFSVIDTIAIDVDQVQTKYDDPNGSSDFWYKLTYYNSVADTETSIASSAAVRGGGFGNYASIDSIRNQAGLQNNRYIADSKIDEKRQAAQRLIDAELNGVYTLPFSEPINPLIAEATRLLAAGYLLTQEYGSNSRTNAQGQAMIERVTNSRGDGILDRINKKELVLTGETGTATQVADVGTYSAWPNSTTGTDSTDATNGAPRMFTTQDRY